MSEERTKLVIDRSRWLRGEGGETSYLIRRSDERMCCLGFFGIACGATSAQLEGKKTPLGCGGDFIAWPNWLAGPGATLSNNEADRLMDANDDRVLEGPERERRITDLFATHGVDVEFVDGPVTP